jgi:hypothetical protein
MKITITRKRENKLYTNNAISGNRSRPFESSWKGNDDEED